MDKSCVAYTDPKDASRIFVRIADRRHLITWEQAQSLRNDLTASLEMRSTELVAVSMASPQPDKKGLE